VRSRKGLRR